MSDFTLARTERRPLLDLIARGQLAGIDVAALSYLPAALNERQRIAAWRWFGGSPVLTHIVDTPIGRIGLFALPIEGDALYFEGGRLLELSREAVHLAHSAGAQIVALTGLLPSALDYGHRLLSALRGASHPIITTGHATTTAAIVLNIQRLLEEADRTLSQESVSFVGLGSIGRTTLRLMLRVLPHPKSLLLCDLYTKHQDIEAIAKSLENEGYRGEIRVARARAGTPGRLSADWMFRRLSATSMSASASNITMPWLRQVVPERSLTSQTICFLTGSNSSANVSAEILKR
jgi:hypothetical protein